MSMLNMNIMIVVLEFCTVGSKGIKSGQVKSKTRQGSRQHGEKTRPWGCIPGAFQALQRLLLCLGEFRAFQGVIQPGVATGGLFREFCKSVGGKFGFA